MDWRTKAPVHVGLRYLKCVIRQPEILVIVRFDKNTSIPPNNASVASETSSRGIFKPPIASGLVRKYPKVAPNVRVNMKAIQNRATNYRLTPFATVLSG